ncbi:hypothetical protein SDC9_98853 [bioreactor metagenome]|uniref:Uncharacterized protein n=1 Tax=bioreactor metagenome TaxID=1076179 RepID=A0A645AGF5_9ZZZZ
MDGQGVLGTDVDEALVGSDGLAADGHGFEHRVRVAFTGRAVHIGTRVPFVGVADDILGIVLYLAGEVPLHPGGEAGAAATTQSCSLQLFDDFLAGHLKECLLQTLIAFTGDIFVDVLGIDETTVAQYDAELLLVELDVLNLCMLAARLLVVEQTSDFAALDHMLADELLGILGSNFYVERVLGKDLDDRALLTETETAGLDDLYFIGESLCLALLYQVLVNLVRAA